jgi:hypothetical protein
MKRILHGPDNLRVELDKSQVYHDNPGKGTPAMVYIYEPFASNPFASSSYSCACCEGELLAIGRDNEDYQLTEQQLTWLQGIEDQVNDYLQW